MPVRIEIDADLLLEAMTRPPEWAATLNPETRAIELGPADSDEYDDEAETHAEGVEIPRVDSRDLLLLGAPGGKTEVLEGKVYRRFHAASAGEARAIFKNVARELCEFEG